MMVLPETISYYFAVLASLIVKFEEEVINCKCLRHAVSFLNFFLIGPHASRMKNGK